MSAVPRKPTLMSAAVLRVTSWLCASRRPAVSENANGRRLMAVARVTSRDAEAVVFKRDGAIALAGRREDRVEHGWRRHADGRLADAAPEPAGRHDDALYLWHFGDPHRVVAVEISLLDVAVLDRAFAVEQRRQAKDERAGDLPLDLRRIDGVAGIGRSDDAVDLHLVAVD